MRTNPPSRHGASPSSWIYLCSFGLLCLLLCVPAVHGGVFDCTDYPECKCPDWYTILDSLSTKVQNISCVGGDLQEVPADGKEGDLVFVFDLSNNNITSITADSFQYFINLQHLNLSYNAISSISVDAFNALTNLQYLDLEGNDITDLPSGLFSINNIISLNIAANPNMVLPDITGQGTIERLDISRNELSSLPEALFKHLNALIFVDASYNEITSLPKNALTKSIQTLDFSHNQISSIDANFINGGNDLMNLDLSHNKIQTLSTETFEAAVQLNILYLNDNSLTILPISVFEGLKELTYLDLRSNKLTMLDTNLFADQGLVPMSIDLTDNQYTCDCDAHSYLYELKHNPNITLIDEEDIECRENQVVVDVFLDWFEESCSGILGTQCTLETDCAARNADCNQTIGLCTCIDEHYDNNEDTNGGVCKPMVGLGDLCDNNRACALNNAQHQICSGTNTYHCMCDDGYYDDNGDHLPHGDCKEKVNLGFECTMSSMCGTLYSYCDTYGKACACLSSYYDDNYPEVNGSCVDKLPLHHNCTRDSQCAPDNSYCDDGQKQCTCRAGFYDLANTGHCLDVTDFFTCFHDEDYEGSYDVEFQLVAEGLTETKCHEHCFENDNRYAIYISNVCVCGIKTTKQQCCPHVGDECNGHHYLNESYLHHVTAGLSVAAIPTLTVGVSSEFSATATLGPIDQIRWNLGDSDMEKAFDGPSSTIHHTYTYPETFQATVSACVKSAGVCETAQLPVKVQIPIVNLTTYLTGYANAKVSESMTDVTATFGEGNNFDYFWYKTDSDGTTHYRKSCPPGWQTHRHTCIKLQTSSANLASAMTQCTALGGRIFKFDFMSEIEEVTDTLSGTTQPMLVGAERESGVWHWKSDASKTIFSDPDMTNNNIGDCVIIEGSTKTLTTTSCSTNHNYICMTDPMECPEGVQHTDGRCFVLSSLQKMYSNAATACSAEYGHYGSYGARLAVIDNQTVHDLVTSMLSPAASSAWFGLSDLTFDGYHTWSDGTAYDFVSTSMYTPAVDDNSHSCFVTTSSSTWSSLACTTPMHYLCEYSVTMERANVQSMVAGQPVIDVGTGNLQQIVQTASFPSTSIETDIILFPGMWFTKSGELRSFVFHTVASTPAEDYQLALQVYRPTCTTPHTLVQPGCAGSLLATCHSTSPVCSPATCSDTTQQFCYLSNQCKPYTQSCTCASETSSAAISACNSYTGSGTEPSYVLQGQIQVTGSNLGENSHTVPADGMSVNKDDIIGIQVPKDKNVIKCEDLPTSEMQQTTYQAVHTDWLTKLSSFPSTSKAIVNSTCYLQAIYTENNIQNMTHNLGYSTTTGMYELAITVPASSVTKKVSTSLEEAVGNLNWIFPAVAEAPVNATSLGTIYTESGVGYNYTLRAGYGTNLQSTWSFDPSTTVSFQSECPSAVASIIADPCNALLVWSDQPFAFMSHTIFATGTSALTLTVKNSVDTQTRELTIRTEKRIMGLSLVSDSDAWVTNTVKVGYDVQFTPSITAGTGESYAYAINGASVAATHAVLTHSFPSAGSYDVEVTASNILNTETFTLSVDAKIVADFANCKFKESSYVAVKDIQVELEFQCDVAVGAEVSARWSTPTIAQPSQSSLTTSSTAQMWTQAFTFTSAPATEIVNITVSDAFLIISMLGSVNVYNAVPSVTLSVSKNNVMVGESVTFTATVPDVPSDYGNVIYTFNTGDGTVIPVPSSSHTETVTHTYSLPVQATADVSVTNGPSTATGNAAITAYERVDGCSVTYDGPSEVNTDTVFSFSISAGSFVNFEISSDDFFNDTSDTDFTYRFDTAGTYNVTVICKNYLSMQAVSIDAYILDPSQMIINSLEIVGGSFQNCIPTGTAEQFEVLVTHFDVPSLTYKWDFGDGSTLVGSATQSYTYSTGGMFDVTATVEYGVTGASNLKSSTVCVQVPITSVQLPVDSLIGLSGSGSTTKTFTIPTHPGTHPQYEWSVNNTLTDVITSSFTYTFMEEGFYEITCTVYNNVSSETVSETVELVELVDGLTLHCTDCVSDSSFSYMQKDTLYTVTATVTSGSDVSFLIDFGDGSPSATGHEQTKSFSTVSLYTITVTATNRVGSSTADLQVYVEVPLTSLQLKRSGILWKTNKKDGLTPVIGVNTQAEFMATVAPSGMNWVKYIWEYYSGATLQISTSAGSYNYATAEYVTCTVTAAISLNNLTSQFSFYVIDQITSVNVKANGTDIASAVVLQKLYIFEITTNSQVNGTQTYIMRMNKDNKLDASSMTNILKYTFDTENIDYKLTVQAENSFGSKLEDFTITGMYEISNPRIVFGSGNGNLTKGASVVLIGSADGTQPQYNWSYSQAPATEAFPTQNDVSTVTVTPNTVGTYVIKLDVYNEVTGAQSEYITINVVEKVTGVSIDTTLTPHDAVKVNTEATFTAAVATGSELSFEWNIYLGSALEKSGTESTFTYLFLTQAMYNVSLSVWNFASSGFVQNEIYSLYEISPFVMDVVGDTVDSGKHYVATGTDLTFTFIITDLDFLAFEWLVDTVSVGTSSTLVTSFSPPATYDVSVVISNKIDSKTSDIEIIAQDEISDLSVMNCPGTYMVASSVALQAQYTAGTDVAIHWELPGMADSDGPSRDVQYWAPGVYTVTVTGSNYIDTLTARCNITVFAEVQAWALSYSMYQIRNYPITFLVVGDNFEGATYDWTFSDGSGPSSSSVDTIDHTFATAGTYTVAVNVSNPVSYSITSIKVTVTSLKCLEPVLHISGSSDRTTLPSRKLSLDISVDTNSCVNYTTVNEWMLYKASSCSASLATPFILPSYISTNTPMLEIPELTLSYGTYCAIFRNSYQDSPVSAMLKIGVTVVPASLKALQAGGSSVVDNEGSSLTIDASGSHDPDQTPGTTILYSWSCVTITSATGNTVCDAVAMVTSAKETLTSLTLTVGDVYDISVTVSAAGRASDTTTQTKTIKSSGAPQVTVTCISCIANGNDFSSRSRKVALEGACTSNCNENTIYEWTIETDAGVAVPLSSVGPSTPANSLNLAINSGVLLDNTGYTFRLTATTGATSGATSGWSAIVLQSTSLPHSGSCRVPVTSVEPLTDRTAIVCENWQDSDLTSALYYKISVWRPGEQYLVFYVMQPVTELYFAPWPETNMGDINVTVSVVNDNNAEYIAFNGTISFTAPVLAAGETKVDFIVNHILTNLLSIVKQNNPRLLMQNAIAIMHSLNEESFQASIAGGTDTECAKRAAVRDLIATAILGVPRSTLQDILQMTSAVAYLTQYPQELQREETQSAVINFIEKVMAEMSGRVKPGSNQGDFEPNNLLTILRNIQSSFVVTEDCGDSIADSLFGDPDQYILEISSTSTPETFANDNARKQAMMEKSLEFSEDVMVVALRSKLAGETAIEYELSGGRKMVGIRERVADIYRDYEYSGARLAVPAAVLDNYGDTEVLQVMMFGPSDLNYGARTVNTISADLTFFYTNSSTYNVQGLSSPNYVVMYLFDSDITPYSIINNSLVNSPDYDPLASVTLYNVSLQAGVPYEANNFTEVESGTAIHIQIRVTFDDNPVDAELTATLYKDDVAYTENDAESLRPKTITPEMMDLLVDHRNYTFFIPPEELTISETSGKSEDAFSVRVVGSHDAVMGMGQHETTCQYYNMDTSSWENEGCFPDSESIATVAVCRCNHLTSYGATLMMSPNAINFADLTRLDIANNPVAIITCSVLLFLYIVGVVACRQLDRLDIKRISTIPLCGKDGSFKYEVTVATGRLVGAGTTAHVGVRICGEYGKTARQHIFKAGAFQRNCADMFIIAYDVNLGDLNKLHIWHDNTGSSPAWYLHQVIVKDLQTDKKYFFFADKWLSLEEEHGCIETELKAADSVEMMRLSRRMKSATFSTLADQHIWMSMLNRPAQSRFTRVQRATCCITLLYTFIGVNAMWYGMLRSADASLGWGSLGWEEAVLALVSNLMVFPINIVIVLLFKKSRLKSNFLEHMQKPQTAETLEIENLCENSQSGSFQSSYAGVPYDLERESTFESVPYAAAGLHRTRHVNNAKRDSISDTLMKQGSGRSVTKSPMWNQDSIMNWPEKTPFSGGDSDSRPSTSCTVSTGVTVKHLPPKPPGSMGAGRKAKGDGKNEPEELVEYLDKLETELNDSDKGKGGTKKPTLRRPTAHKSNWGSLEDILNSDDESSVADSSRRLVKKRGSTASSTLSRKFNPRADPRIAGNTRWPRPRESLVSSTIGEESMLEGHSNRGITAGLTPGYYRDMLMQSRMMPPPVHKEGCTLPPWCVYVAYVLCFLLSCFSVIIVILYCFKFGYDESLQWILACLLSLVQSVLLFEPLKVVFIAGYVLVMFDTVEEKEDENCINVAPTYDTSNEKIKDIKFKPISGFALMQAREDGRKSCRLKLMLRQFAAYVFYLWLLMVIVYVNFSYSNYLLTKNVEHDFIDATTTDDLNFRNVTSIEEFWEWTEGVFAESLHLQDSLPDEEHGFLLGPARLRLIRSTERTCEASSAAASLGAAVLTNRTCYGTTSFEEDTKLYGEGWNESSYNLSWKHQSASQLGSGAKLGHMGLYGGGGYAQVLGTSQAHTLTLIQDLRSKDWVNLRTRAVFLEWSVYSAGSDTTATTSLLVEFPLTGGAITDYEIQSQRLLWFQENRVDPLIICEVILFLVVVYSLIHIAMSIRDNGRQFLKDWWNWYEMLTILMTVVAIGMYIGCVVEATNAFNSYLGNRSGFTNFERVADVHVGMRYLHACLLFLLMFKVVKQLRFIKFMYVYEKTLSNAVGLLLGAGLIFIVLLMVYAQLGYLMYGRFVAGFQSFGHTMSTLVVMIRGTFDFWPMLDYQPIFSHFYVYSYYAFVYGLTIALVISILNNTYRVTKSQMFYKATLDMRDYEMVDFMLKRFKVWAGITKPKPAFRKVKFQGLPSLSSRSSTSLSSRATSSLRSSSPLGPEFSRIQLNTMMARIGPTWQAVLWRLDKIMSLDTEEEKLVTKTESEIKELNWKIRINELERERCELLNWTTMDGRQPGTSTADRPPLEPKRRQMILQKLSSLSDTGVAESKAPATVSGATRSTLTPPSKGDNPKHGKRPVSDQGARIELKQTESSSVKAIQKFFKSVKPSKPAWNGS